MPYIAINDETLVIFKADFILFFYFLNVSTELKRGGREKMINWVLMHLKALKYNKNKKIYKV